MASYSLLAHLFPRIKGSQEDVATYSLSYILEQSLPLNQSFTYLICERMNVELNKSTLIYNCQDADEEYGRPDIAGYHDGQLLFLCEAKFYAGLTVNQPVSYIERLKKESGLGLIFICPQNRKVSLWNKLKTACSEQGLSGKHLSEYCIKYDGVRMAVISWQEIIAELMRVATVKDPEKIGDLRQLQGFCDKVESDAFVPFRPEEFGSNEAKKIDRYYEVVDATYRYILTHYKELNPDVKGLRKAPRWQGYSRYVKISGVGVSIDFIRALWKSPASIETPFWFHIAEIDDKGKWGFTDKVSKFMESIDGTKKDFFIDQVYIALEPKPFLNIDEMAKDLAEQIVAILEKFCKN